MTFEFNQKMFQEYDNQIKIAVDRIGGPTKTSTLLGVATGTVHSWIRSRRVSNIDYAKILAQASGLKLQDLRWTK